MGNLSEKWDSAGLSIAGEKRRDGKTLECSWSTDGKNIAEDSSDGRESTELRSLFRWNSGQRNRERKKTKFNRTKLFVHAKRRRTKNFLDAWQF